MDRTRSAFSHTWPFCCGQKEKVNLWRSRSKTAHGIISISTWVKRGWGIRYARSVKSKTHVGTQAKSRNGSVKSRLALAFYTELKAKLIFTWSNLNLMILFFRTKLTVFRYWHYALYVTHVVYQTRYWSYPFVLYLI